MKVCIVDRALLLVGKIRGQTEGWQCCGGGCTRRDVTLGGDYGFGGCPRLLIPEPPEADELSEEASEDEVFIFCDKELLLLWLLLLDIFASISIQNNSV